jgi:glycosyltransferase involved in cell wall biosynthesis
MSRRLVIIFDGQPTINRLAHILKLVKIVENLFQEVVVVHEGHSITSLNKGRTRDIGYGNDNIELNAPFVLKVFRFVISELRKIKYVVQHISTGDVALFLGIYQPLAIIAVKMRGADAVLFGGGFDVSRSPQREQSLDFAHLLKWAFQISMIRCFQRVILESPLVETSFNLSKFKTKMLYHGHLFVDENKFMPTNDLNTREFDVAYVAALSPEKGAIRFVESLPIIFNKKPVKALMVGDGVARQRIEHYIEENRLQGIVELKGYVDYRDMPSQLNRTKILVLPSSSEGLPNVILEAMAVRTIVLASAVGGIPDVIREGETGFLLRSLTPQHIAERSIELLNEPELLKKVTYKAYKFLRENFGYEKTLECWREIFSKVMHQ